MECLTVCLTDCLPYRALIKGWGQGFSPSTFPRNKKQIEPKQLLSCSISHLQIAYNHQLDICVTAQTLKPFRFAWLLVCFFFTYTWRSWAIFLAPSSPVVLYPSRSSRIMNVLLFKVLYKVLASFKRKKDIL